MDQPPCRPLRSQDMSLTRRSRLRQLAITSYGSHKIDYRTRRTERYGGGLLHPVVAVFLLFDVDGAVKGRQPDVVGDGREGRGIEAGRGFVNDQVLRTDAGDHVREPEAALLGRLVMVWQLLVRVGRNADQPLVRVSLPLQFPAWTELRAVACRIRGASAKAYTREV